MNGIADIVSSVMGIAGGVLPKGVPQSKIGSRSYMRIPNGDAAYNTVALVLALITGVAHADFFKIWQHTVPAQRLTAWGYGSPALQRNQGFMWFTSLLPTTDFDVGTLRIIQAKAREHTSMVVAELPDEGLHTADFASLIAATPGNINEKLPFPEKVEFPLIGEDSLMILTYALEVASAGHTAAGFEIPVTIYD